jgi:hypothetical protein
MSNQKSDDDQVAQRFDKLLLKLLKAPPQSRAELAEQVRPRRERRLPGISGSAPAQKASANECRR